MTRSKIVCRCGWIGTLEDMTVPEKVAQNELLDLWSEHEGKAKERGEKNDA